MPKMKVWNGTAWITLDANNADTVDGKHASDFAPSSHVGSGGDAHAVATTSVAGFMSATDKAKLDGIQSGAEVNQNTFSNVKVGNTTIVADSKTDTLELVAGSNIILTPDEVNDKITISSTAAVASVNGRTGAVTLNASDVGAIPASQKGAANGVATLDGNTKVPTSQLPSASTTTQGIVQLVDSVTSTSTTQAATANAVKQANDNANNRVSKSGDTMTGTLTIDGGGGVLGLKAGSIDHVYIELYADSHAPGTRSSWIGYGSSGTNLLSITNEMTDGNINFNTKGSGIVTINNNKVWHQGNDGAGSGLDADLLDGFDSTAFVKKAGDTMTGQLNVPSLVAQIAIPSDSPPSAWPDGFVAGTVYNNGYPVPCGTIFSYKGTSGKSVVQILQAWPGNDGGEAYLYIRSARDTGADVFGPWRKVWSENNDGAGSGLDADMVDGKHLSDIQAEVKSYTDQQITAMNLNITAMNLNIIDMAVELETLKGATLNGVTANIFIETFTNLNDINLMNGSYDSVNKRLVV